jgi:ring-1,2-phenylacetyl-CoA epoxidase subunit PaaC
VSAVYHTTNSFCQYLLHLADTTLILSQRNAEWCGHGPVLEQDIAITNISLDLLGQSRNFYQLAATLMGENIQEDQLAFLRTERQFANLLLTELPKGDWAQTVLRQFFFSQFQQLQLEQLTQHPNEQLAAMAVKSLKETQYHLRWSREWVIRLGDGTTESHQRLSDALTAIWQYTGEMFIAAPYEIAEKQDPNNLHAAWMEKVKSCLAEANLTNLQQLPDFMHQGGKIGKHTEYMGYILTEMQYLQRVYPNCEW